MTRYTKTAATVVTLKLVLKLYIVYLDFFACIFAVYFLGENKAPCKFHCYCLKFTTNTPSPPKKCINNFNICIVSNNTINYYIIKLNANFL